MFVQQSKTKDDIFFPHQDLNHGLFETKAIVLPMSYAVSLCDYFSNSTEMYNFVNMIIYDSLEQVLGYSNCGHEKRIGGKDQIRTANTTLTYFDDRSIKKVFFARLNIPLIFCTSYS